MFILNIFEIDHSYNRDIVNYTIILAFCKIIKIKIERRTIY